jgi:hypothetical protein
MMSTLSVMYIHIYIQTYIYAPGMYIYNALDITYFRYFDTELKDGIYLSEDYWFCDRWRQLGGKIYIYTKFKCRHWGTYAY